MNYIIRASDLYNRAKEILNSGMDYVEISLMEPDDSDPSDPLPAAVTFEAFRKHTPYERRLFEEIEVVSQSDI